MATHPTNLTEQELANLRNRIKTHIRALNAAGTVSDSPDQPSVDTLLNILGVKKNVAGTLAEQWLCGCDGNACGGNV